MSVAKFAMRLDWKEDLSLDLNMVDVKLKELAGENCCGNQAAAQLEIWFLEEPAQEIKDLIQAYWDSLDESSPEAEAYKSADARKEEAQAKKASGKAKLLALGLTEEEVAALMG